MVFSKWYLRLLCLHFTIQRHAKTQDHAIRISEVAGHLIDFQNLAI